MHNRVGKTVAAVGVVITSVVLGASAAFATGPTFDPGAEATTQFNSGWTSLLDMVKDIAPLAIGAGLVLLAIRKVAGAFRRGKAPSV